MHAYWCSALVLYLSTAILVHVGVSFENWRSNKFSYLKYTYFEIPVPVDHRVRSVKSAVSKKRKKVLYLLPVPTKFRQEQAPVGPNEY